MNKKKIVAFLVFANLFFILCLAFLLVFHKKADTGAPVASINVMSTDTNDANSQSQSSKPAMKPEDILACFSIGKEQRRLKAIEDYSQIMRSEPPYLGALTEIYRFAKNGQWDKAQGTCDHFIQYGEDKREALYSLAWLYTRQGRYKDAIESSKELTANYPAFVKPYSILGWIAAKEGRNDEAVAACTKIISITPDNAMGHYGLGRLYAMMDKPAEAITAYSEAIRLKPDFAEAYLFLGLIYCQQSMWADALKAFGSAVSIDRGYEQAHLFLAVTYDELGMYKEESEALEQAIGLSTLRSNTKEQWRILGLEPDYARFNCGLAEAYARLGEYHKAVLACKDAIAINPTYSEAYYNMTLAYLLLGDRKAALEQRDKLVSLKANDLMEKLNELLN
jgi:tetratricopeptide (TPR) repeat protein